AASISPAISAATAKGLRGIKMNCMSRPCFLNKPRSRATHTAVMLSLVTLDDRFDLTWPATSLGAQTGAEKAARSRKRTARIPPEGPIVIIGRASIKDLRGAV